jgi:hypothetical protein
VAEQSTHDSKVGGSNPARGKLAVKKSKFKPSLAWGQRVYSEAGIGVTSASIWVPYPKDPPAEHKLENV